VNRVQHSVVTESELQRALDCGELIRLYQPVVELDTGAPVQVEALLRWDHPARGLLAPAAFLLGEDDGDLLVRIGWSVVIEAARRAGEWRRCFPNRPVTVSVNLFDEHLERRDLPGRVETLLVDNEVPGPHALAFELGERHLREPNHRTRDRLLALHNLGVEIVVDDFGAVEADGDGSPTDARDSAIVALERRGRFPLDVVKLDPRLVERLGTVELVAEVVDAAHANGARAVAMAVEDEPAANRAFDAGFDLAQGFHFARPQRPARIDELLAVR
jgi:EAL domain-containing protein (putative c-di-GMP-specific phosphodiesterase class I)